jgi:hypothetical protein
MNDQDQRNMILAEKRSNIIEHAVRMYWMTRTYKNYSISIGVEVSNSIQDQDQQVFDTLFDIILDSIKLELSDTDSLSNRIAISNYIFDKLASGYINRDIHIEVADSNGNKFVTYYIYK